MPITHASWSRPEEERAGTLTVVALHGRGADETTMAAMGRLLPQSVTIVAPRGPIAVEGGYTWFENRGIGRPLPESIAQTAAELREWMNATLQDGEPVVLMGFSGGTAMAGGLLLLDPTSYTAAVLLSGTLPWDAGIRLEAQRLSGLSVFWANDPADPVIPHELVARSEEWLRKESGAQLVERHYSGIGHSIGPNEIRDINAFLEGLTS